MTRDIPSANHSTPPPSINDPNSSLASGGGSHPIAKIAMLGLFLAIGAVLYYQFGDTLSLDRLVEQESQLRQLQTQHPRLVVIAAFALYVLATAFSLPGATVLSLLYAWYFRFWVALPLVSFASTLGATLAFLMSRYVLRDTIQTRFGDRLKSFNESLERDGAFFLLTLRLIPVVPFFLINIVMGPTTIRTRTFWWVSQLGMLPATVVYLLAGSSVPTLQELATRGTVGIFTPRIWIAFALLAMFPFLTRAIMSRFTSTPATGSPGH